MGWLTNEVRDNFLAVGTVLLFYIANVTSVASNYECSVSSTCVPSQYCEFKGVKSLKWCDEKNTKVCCPNSILYDKPAKEINYEDSYSSYSTGSATDGKDRPSYIPVNEAYIKDYGAEYADYRDFEDGDSKRSLSKEAKRILQSYQEKECGVRRSFYGKISTGPEVDLGIAKYGEFPWQAAVLLRVEGKFDLREAYKYICGGTVINPKLVLTAAHCVKGMKLKNLKVKLGEWNLKGSQGEMFSSIERKIERAIIHDYYNSATFAHDIAILVLNKPLNLRKTPHVSQVCLPPKHTKFDEYSKCYIVGWGDDNYKPNYGSNILKVARVSLMKQDCRHKLKESIPSLSNNFLKEDISCVSGSLGKDACVGDGGGAIICPLENSEVPVCRQGYNCEEEHYFIAGVISWGSDKCGQEDSVTVVTDISTHYEWILDKIRKYGGIDRFLSEQRRGEYGSNTYDDTYWRDDDGNYGRYENAYNYQGYKYDLDDGFPHDKQRQGERYA